MAFVNTTECMTDWSWDFFVEFTPWPMIHLINNFTVAMITQSPMWTFIWAVIWEMFERTLLVCGNGSYLVFLGDGNNSMPETCSDSVLGDLWHCILGIILFFVFTASMNTPIWSIPLKVHKQFGYKSWWWARKILGTILTVPTFFSGVDYVTKHGTQINIIAFVMLFLYPLAVLGYAFLTHLYLPEMIKFYWRNNYTHFWNLHIAWALCGMILASSATYMHWSVYYQAWIHAGILIVFIIVFGTITNTVDLLAIYKWLTWSRTIFDALRNKFGYPTKRYDVVISKFITMQEKKRKHEF